MELFGDRYRPRTLDDVPLSTAARDTFRALSRINCLDVVLNGVPGCGKTTLAHILVNEYFEQAPIPPQQVIYINSLHDQGIRFYRTELKQFCRTVSSVPGKKKLVVLDDLDTVSEHMQQILQSYVSDFSNTVSFILVCSNLQKVTDAIQSRSNVVRVAPPTDTDVARLVQRVSSAENMDLSAEVQRAIVAISGRSMKSALNCLEKIYLGAPKPSSAFSVAECNLLCSDITDDQFAQYMAKVRDGSVCCAVNMLFGMYDRGFSVVDILDCMYQSIVARTDETDEAKYAILTVICEYMAVFYNIHEHKIELALFTHKLHTVLTPEICN